MAKQIIQIVGTVHSGNIEDKGHWEILIIEKHTLQFCCISLYILIGLISVFKYKNILHFHWERSQIDRKMNINLHNNSIGTRNA